MRQAQALKLMVDGASVFLTGPPGAGKTYVLNRFVVEAKRQGKKVALTASTGIAATHIGGSTIHSWSGLGIRDHVTAWDLEKLSANAKLIKRYNSTDVLVIDEVSMLHGSRLDMVNVVAKKLRDDPQPFGGMQVVLVGDLFQLPPITHGASDMMADFVHLSDAWTELNPRICYLTEQHRQAAGDALLDILNAMRSGELHELHEAALSERLTARPPEGAAVTKLYSHNIDVDAINARHLAAIDGDTRRFRMSTHGGAAKIEQLAKSVLAPADLELKRGAEVMFVANNFGLGFVNGTRGRVVDFAGDSPLVVTAEGREVTVEPHSWKLEEDGRVSAEISQLPLRLAWAITIHKSQGMSLDAAEIDLSRSFTPGMGYVALSRVRSLDGIYLKGVNQMALRLHPLIFAYDGELRSASAKLAELVEDYMVSAVSTVAVKDDEQMIEDELLFGRLREWRLGRARRDKVAPFIIAHDTLLHELASRKPQTGQALLGCKGFGKAKLETYGDELLAILKESA